MTKSVLGANVNDILEKAKNEMMSLFDKHKTEDKDDNDITVEDLSKWFQHAVAALQEDNKKVNEHKFNKVKREQFYRFIRNVDHDLTANNGAETFTLVNYHIVSPLVETLATSTVDASIITIASQEIEKIASAAVKRSISSHSENENAEIYNNLGKHNILSAEIDRMNFILAGVDIASCSENDHATIASIAPQGKIESIPITEMRNDMFSSFEELIQLKDCKSGDHILDNSLLKDIRTIFKKDIVS